MPPAMVQKPDKEFSNPVMTNRHLAMAVGQYGIRFVERHEPFQVTGIGTFHEELLEVIGFHRWFVRQ